MSIYRQLSIKRVSKLCVFSGAVFLLCTACSAETATQPVLSEKKALTIYDQGLAYIRDVRQFDDLATGRGELIMQGLSDQLYPESIQAEAATDSSSFRILEQSYMDHSLNPQELLEDHVGKMLKIKRWNEYQDREEVVEAKLLSTTGPTYQIDDEIYIGHPGVQILPMPERELKVEPTLTWVYANSGASSRLFDLSYLSRGLSWQANYVLSVHEENDTADLSCWVTLKNSTNLAIEDAELKLVSGQLQSSGHRPSPMQPRMMKAMASFAEADSVSFSQENLFEFHLFRFSEPISLKRFENKQVNFLTPRPIQIERTYHVTGRQGYFSSYRAPSSEAKLPVKVQLKFKNEKANELGMPLPQGNVRLYYEASNGDKEYTGESNVGYVAVDEDVKLQAGTAFDLIAERVQTDYNRLSNKMHESEWKITLRNRKSEDVVIEVEEPISGKWEVLQSSHPYEKNEAFKINFSVKVLAGEEAEVSYRVRIGI